MMQHITNLCTCNSTQHDATYYKHSVIVFRQYIFMQTDIKCCKFFLVQQSFICVVSSRDISTAISNLLQMTTARWRHSSHSMQTYHSGVCSRPCTGWPFRRSLGAHTRVICLHRMTTVSPCSGSRLKKIV